jgi:hypothetical protein
MSNKLYEALEVVVLAENQYNSYYAEYDEAEQKMLLARRKLETAKETFNDLIYETKREIADK